MTEVRGSLHRTATKNAIHIYNNKRLHLSLNYKTPKMIFEYQDNECLICSRILGLDKD